MTAASQSGMWSLVNEVVYGRALRSMQRTVTPPQQTTEAGACRRAAFVLISLVHRCLRVGRAADRRTHLPDMVRGGL